MTDPFVHLPHPSVAAEEYGAKARWLNWLLRRGYPVPPCFCAPKTTTPPGREWLSPLRAAVDGLDPRLARPDRPDPGTGSRGRERYELAIRSSAPAEDHRSESTAGVFESELGSFTVEEMLDAFARVVESGPRDVPVGVVVQRLVRPRFSGLAHSSHP